MKCFENLKLKVARMLSSNMPSHFNITSGAMSSSNIAPLDYAWVTFQIMLFHYPIFVLIVGKPLMAALITDYMLVAFTFK